MLDVEKLLILDMEKVLSKYKTLGHIASCLQKQFTEGIPTEAIGFDDKAEIWTLYINPKDYMKYDEDHRICILLHEISHLLFNHPPRFKDLMKQFNEKDRTRLHSLSNIAADCVVNDLIELTCEYKYANMFPKDSTYKNLEGKTGITKSDDDTMESLFYKLLQLPQNKQKELTGGDSGNKHVKWMQGQGTTQEAQSEELSKCKLLELIENANIATEGFSDMPAKVRGMIKKAIEAKISLERELMIEGYGTIKASKRLCKKRPSRRLGFPYPGKKSSRQGKILVASDVSGSVPTRAKQKFLNIIHRMANRIDVEMVAFDVQIVQHIKNWKREPIGIQDTGGGTDPQCVFDLIKNRSEQTKPSKIFILTDGEFGNINTYNIPTVFILTNKHARRKEGKNLYFE